MSKQYVFLFEEGDAKKRELLGGKGANLAEMTKLGMPVPAGFTISTEACTRYYDDGKKIEGDIEKEILSYIKKLEKKAGKEFGSLDNPLLVSVRSGARASMPGMMDTILNLGLNDKVVKAFAKKTNNPRFAYDSYRRFIQMYSDVVMEVGKSFFEKLIDEMKAKRKVTEDTELTADDLKELADQFKIKYKEKVGESFPQDPVIQLFGAITAVFRSWDNPRANVYRRMNDIPYSWGTAVNIQTMVFGNMGETSGTGVAFSRDPSTGEKKLYGEYLMNAQGEDVVAGVRTPLPIAKLKEQNPDVYDQFVNIVNKLEKHYKDMQDMEFTIENEKLYMLQTRNGKRTAAAALKIAIDLVKEKMITEKQAIKMIDPKQLDSLLHPTFDPVKMKTVEVIGEGIAGSPGAATGRIVFTAEEALVETGKHGERVVLVRLETSPEDIEGMQVAEGILTARGGKTSHAAVVARGMGTPCVVGLGSIKFAANGQSFALGGKTYRAGDDISIDGATGKVYGEALDTIPATFSNDFKTIMKWADKYRTLKVRTNADTPQDAKQAVLFGAEGIGLCRTEHMFFEKDRIAAIREMIVADSVEQRVKALNKILPMQKKDFVKIYETMEGRPVTIRLLDPPLHEFLPTDAGDIKMLAREMQISEKELKDKIASLHEFNPMMGHRGCRLAVTYPEIAVMQTTAIIEAAIEVDRKYPSRKIIPEIMVPLVGDEKELIFVKKYIKKTADDIILKRKSKVKYM
ncbi:MAG: pyruvate, phosphate dikinase, partial [Clostridiales Family XIII bacterium]|nr:pyruvate, phosphate dikinase [Clostridiales Family XIII bacterium]